MTAPAVHALSIVFRAPDGNGNTNETRINVLQGNIFDPQLGILGNNVSNNSTSGSGTSSTANNPLVNNIVFNNPVTRLINSVLNYELVIGGAASGLVNNSTQISFLSFNIFNPQASIFGGNLSNNTTNTNIADGLGNNTTAPATGIPNLWTSWFGGMAGNGNTSQTAVGSFNITNPQASLGGSNQSDNTAVTNEAIGNGNDSQTSGASGLSIGTTGNGNTNQTAVGSGNIENTQVSAGDIGVTPRPRRPQRQPIRHSARRKQHQHDPDLDVGEFDRFTHIEFWRDFELNYAHWDLHARNW